MRKHLQNDVQNIYRLDLGGNVRRNPDLSGTTHNVFGIQVGVTIGLFVRNVARKNKRAKIMYFATERDWRKQERFNFLDAHQSVNSIAWRELLPDERSNWITEGLHQEFSSFLILGDEATKNGTAETAIFRLFSNGLSSNRDAWVYNFQSDALTRSVQRLITNYNSEVGRFLRNRASKFSVNPDSTFVKWTDRLKDALEQGKRLSFDGQKLRPPIHIPFTNNYFNF